MKWYYKALIGLGGLIVVGLMCFIVYNQISIKNQQNAMQNQLIEQKELTDGIMRSQNSVVTKDDLVKMIKENNIDLDAIQKDLDLLHAEIAAVNIMVAKSQGQHGSNIPTTPGTGTNPNPVDPSNPDPYDYMKRQQTLSLFEQFSGMKIPFGSVGFSAWQEKPWDFDIKAREYHVATVVGKDEDGRNHFYNKFTVKVDGKDYEVPITSAVSEQALPEPKWHWWNPKIFLTAGGGINMTSLPVNGNFNAGVTFGFMDWGRLKASPDISVLQTGVGYSSNENEFAVIINPVAFNIGNAADFDPLKNTYIGPSVQITHTGQVFGGANVSIGF